MQKEEYNNVVLMTARLLGLQKEVNYLQMFGLQGEKGEKLDAFLEKVDHLRKNNKGARIVNQQKEKYFMFTEKQAYRVAQAALRNNIEL